ncbi:MAG: methionyl-tRNA formyltransferase [Candidatus Omnitrophota bacterium]
MNIIFFGSGNFAVPSLRALAAIQHNLLCVVTQPDKKQGRGLHLASTIIKETAKELNLKFYQPPDINSVESIEFLKSLKSDLFVVIAYGQILSGKVLNVPKFFAINIHASLLPKFRGAAPINWAIIKGEKNTGVTVMKMTREMDAGPIILQNSVNINIEDNAASLGEKLSKTGADLLIKTLPMIEGNNYNALEQDKSVVTFAQKLTKKDGLINWQSSAGEINNLIRGCYVWPGAFTYYKGKLLKICKAKAFLSIEEKSSKPIPGEITRVLKDNIVVCSGKGDLIIEELQIEGKRKMLVKEFIAGHKMCAGEILGLHLDLDMLK